MRNVVRMREGLQHCMGVLGCRGCPYQKVAGCARMLAQEIDSALAELEALQGWTPVTEGTPDEGDTTKYLIVTRTKTGMRSINMAWYDGQSWHGTGTHAEVTHWMEQPKLPVDIPPIRMG